ncbi:MAG: LysR family transcriptional regulator [Synergistaceae bacterium]|nr:LysR family transcriptional regulator [Synergistaceae bacterium]
MEFDELRYMTTVAKHKNVSKAAKELGIAQSSLSKYIHTLEHRYGVKFFRYINKSFRPTHAGVIYLQTAKKMLQYMERLSKEAIRCEIARERKILRIFCPMFKSIYIMPNIVPQFKKQYPDVSLVIKEATSNTAEAMLLNKVVDIAVTNFEPKDRNIRYEPLLKEEIQLVVSKHNPLIHEGIWKPETETLWIDIQLFRHESFILPAPEQMIRQAVDIFFKQENIVPNVLMETKNIESAFLVAANGAGVTFIPEYFTHSTSYLQTPVTFSVGNKKLEMQSMIAYRRDYDFPPEAAYVINLIKQLMA